MKILFVENYRRFADITAKTFLPSHLVTIIPRVSVARRALLEGAFDVVLIDYDLDGGKGDALLSDMQSHSCRAVVIAISSHTMGNQALLAAGADAICSKMDFQNIETINAEARAEARATTREKN
ncbi:MAG TPA: response regulator [Abditibacteriaceae bacterium]|jgi:DNA-binding response OmpR family regulator|nr:response regulator [Abditibacteriaceae bacterium]